MSTAKTTIPVAPKQPVRTFTGSSDVAYTNGTVPTTDTRDFWTSLTPAKSKTQDATDKAVLNQKPTIAAKQATDTANQKQAAAAATGVVNDTVASKAAAAAAAAVTKGNKTTRNTILFGVAAVAALIAGATWFLKKKKKIA